MSEYYFSLSFTPNTLFSWKLVWHSKIPPRVAFFSWTVALGKILTLENLWYKGVAVVDWCCMCEKRGESMNHSSSYYYSVCLFLDFFLTHSLWILSNFVHLSLGCPEIFAPDLAQIFEEKGWYHGKSEKKRYKLSLSLIFHCPKPFNSTFTWCKACQDMDICSNQSDKKTKSTQYSW